MVKFEGVDKGKKEETTLPLIMEENAWAWYTNPLSLGGNGRPRNWLPLKKLADIASAMGRSITLDELQMLIQKDGPTQKCRGCGGDFQPVKIVAVNRWLLDRLKNGGNLLTLEGLRWIVGSFVLFRGGDRRLGALGFCGSLFYFDPKMKDEDGCEKFFTNKQSCLGNAFLSKENRDQDGHPRHTRSVESGESIVKAEAEILEIETQAKKKKIEADRAEARKIREHRISGVEQAFKNAKSERRNQRR